VAFVGGKMIYYKIGCNFDQQLIKLICEINSIKKDTIINEFYGSDRAHAKLTARPKFRLPDIDAHRFTKYIMDCRDAGIKFNYTMNTMYPGSKRQLSGQISKIEDHVKFLIDSGVSIITISTPLFAEIIRNVSNDIELEVSTIAHIDTVTQIKAWFDCYHVSRVCGNLLKNRSSQFLIAEANFCKRNNIVLNLMVNEFCSTGGRQNNSLYATHCIYRDSCYLCHSENETIEDNELLDSYPMGHCISSRNHPSTWLKSMFIRPEDISLYERIGINHFKITGRTASTDYITTIAKAYVNGRWDGNLLTLWKPLETITSGEAELDFCQNFYIDNSKLDGFLKLWFNKDGHECAKEVCGETCTYCDEFYANHLISGG
jgi:collagenase-like PrtC family protease